ncbi:flagellar hook-length control protein FliK [Rhodoblastus acidophilus]|uniref:Flagellar hook-length control protein FliK n=1 Tax=Candidatus Rhodoblastus alkanivorans TaxID=2954117 RepID=A0ABS9Z3R9_9HYPH|nr:flagellar hook-length control protein FliK [Candidatus Rhodoblastus alkanivorans]MCI4678838.1 flagellar hook-length control protein FliK [Candidatus Rhodoblastus alkanivorans]MCI4682227.1 flagellar hook-length control protein FliK [Candidatus Rhodoblastus alkanivorans]MDI4639529.1 flagellar hook-length control protein FliK [Rhodoblastus acidophilus]
MSAFGLTILNLPIGGALSGAKSGRDRDQDRDAAEAFDATLAESARDAAAPETEKTRLVQIEAATETPARSPTTSEDKNGVASGASGDDLLRDLLNISSATKVITAVAAGTTPVTRGAVATGGKVSPALGQDGATDMTTALVRGAAVATDDKVCPAFGHDGAADATTALVRGAVATGAAMAQALAEAAGRDAQAIPTRLPDEAAASSAMAKRASSAIHAKDARRETAQSLPKDFVARDLATAVALPSATAAKDGTAASSHDDRKDTKSDDDAAAPPDVARAPALSPAAATPVPDLNLAATVASSVDPLLPNGEKVASGAHGATKDADRSARSATATGSSRADSTSAAQAAGDAATIHLAADSAADAASTPVHVVDLKSWHAPTAPDTSSAPGLVRQPATSAAAAHENSPSEAKPPEAKAPATSTPVAFSTASATTAFATVPTAAPSLNSAVASAPPGAAPFQQASGAGAASPTASPAAYRAGPRRDIEVTLEPKELGGLSVRMRSRGDRLEIAFVAEKGETARLIDDKSANLQSQLRDAGLGLGGVDIHVAEKPNVTLPSAAAGGGASFGTSQQGGRHEPGASSPRPQFTGRGKEGMRDDSSDRANDSRAPRGDRGLYL